MAISEQQLNEILAERTGKPMFTKVFPTDDTDIY